MSCLENIEIPTCIWFSNDRKRKAISSIIAGILFFSGWWIIIDAHVTCPLSFKGAYHLCGVFGTISFIMVNAVNNAMLDDNGYGMGHLSARIWMFVGLIAGFASLIASCWILFADFVTKNTPQNPVQQWAGIGLFLQNCFIFVSSLIFKFGRGNDENVW